MEDRLVTCFIPKISGREARAEERSLLALPVKLAGLALPNPTASPDSAWTTSWEAVGPLSDAILSRAELDVVSHSPS